MEHITYAQVIEAASDEFSECIQLSVTGDKYTDLKTAAARMCHRMGIGRFAWIKACSTMGDTAAAVAVLIIDRNRQHPIIPVVNPGGVLRGMTAKAKAGDVRPEFPPVIRRARFQNIALCGHFDQADMGHAPYRLDRRIPPALLRHVQNAAERNYNHASKLPVRPWHGAQS